MATVHVFARCAPDASGRVSLSLRPCALGNGGAAVVTKELEWPTSKTASPDEIIAELPPIDTAKASKSARQTPSLSARIGGAAKSLASGLNAKSGEAAKIVKSMTPRMPAPVEKKRKNFVVTIERESRNAPLHMTLENVDGVGVVVTAIDEHSDAYAGGLRAGDLLLTVGSLAVEDAYEANSVMKRVLGEVEMTISRYEGAYGLPRGWRAIDKADSRWDGSLTYQRMVKGADGKWASESSKRHPAALPPSARETETPRTTRGPLSEIAAQ